MRLKWIKVEGLYSRFNHHVELKEEGLTIIHSPNGLGKSTLVKMVCLAFGGRWDELRSIPFHRLEFGFEEDRKLVFLMDETLEVTLLASGDIIPMTKEEVMDIQNVNYLGPQRLFMQEPDGRYVTALDVYSARMASMFKEFESLAHDIWVQDLKPNQKHPKDPHSRLLDVRARMEVAYEAGLEPDLGITRGRDLMDDDPQSWDEDALNALGRLGKVADALFPLAEGAVALMDMINPLLFRKRLSLDSESGMVITLDEGRQLDLSMLSSGEQQLLLMLYILMFEASPGGLVIVDEPEISMHITWQQRIASLFLKIGRARDLQIVMATHSPQVVHDRWDLTEELVV